MGPELLAPAVGMLGTLPVQKLFGLKKNWCKNILAQFFFGSKKMLVQFFYCIRLKNEEEKIQILAHKTYIL